jgi:hypothetical protein
LTVAIKPEFIDYAVSGPPLGLFPDTDMRGPLAQNNWACQKDLNKLPWDMQALRCIGHMPAMVCQFGQHSKSSKFRTLKFNYLKIDSYLRFQLILFIEVEFWRFWDNVSAESSPDWLPVQKPVTVRSFWLSPNVPEGLPALF